MAKKTDRKWRVIDLLTWTTGHFQKQNIPSARLDAELLLAHALDSQRLQLYLRFQEIVPPKQLAAFRELVRQRAARVPLAYLTHEREFMGLSFYVDESVLIPRPETETLVEIVEERESGEDCVLLDIGTGSGAIAVSLAKRKGWTVVATDLSADALAVARQNADAHEVEAQIDFREGDLFAAVDDNSQFDWIISNPPYICSATLPTLEPEIAHEPRMALDGGADGLDVLRELLLTSPDYLRPGGSLIAEMGHEHADTLRQMVSEQSSWAKCSILHDYSKVERFLLVERS